MICTAAKAEAAAERAEEAKVVVRQEEVKVVGPPAVAAGLKAVEHPSLSRAKRPQARAQHQRMEMGVAKCQQSQQALPSLGARWAGARVGRCMELREPPLSNILCHKK